MAFRFRPNAGFQAELKRSPEWKAWTFRLAEQGASVGRQHASKGFMGPVSAVRAEHGPNGAQIVHDSPGWHLEEYGSPTTAPRAPLRKAAEAIGRYVPTR